MLLQPSPSSSGGCDKDNCQIQIQIEISENENASIQRRRERRMKPGMGGTLPARPNGTCQPSPCSEAKKKGNNHSSHMNKERNNKKLTKTNMMRKGKNLMVTCWAELSSAASLVFAQAGSLPTENLDIQLKLKAGQGPNTSFAIWTRGQGKPFPKQHLGLTEKDFEGKFDAQFPLSG